ncbi:Protein of unknown function [Gryllus bimaculatus]|nr:Protein of unknown function [Gryllus bimaculatus]
MALKGTVVARAAIVGVLCVLIDVSSEERQAATLFSFSISSRRNSTGHRHIRAIFNIPENGNSSNSEDAWVAVEQNKLSEENRKIVQLLTTIIGRRNLR